MQIQILVILYIHYEFYTSDKCNLTVNSPSSDQHIIQHLRNLDMTDRFCDAHTVESGLHSPSLFTLLSLFCVLFYTTYWYSVNSCDPGNFYAYSIT